MLDYLKSNGQTVSLLVDNESELRALITSLVSKLEENKIYSFNVEKL